MLKYVLCATDISQHSEAVLRLAANISRKYEAKLTVLYVVPLLNQNVELWLQEHVARATDVAWYDHVSREAGKKIQELLERHYFEKGQKGSSTALEYNVIVRHGHPGNEVIKAAQECGVDLVVIGSHGLHALPSALLGGTAHKVVTHCPVPVLVVRHE